VVEDVLSSPDRIQGIQGFAGSGKTTTLSVIRRGRNLRGIKSRASLQRPAPRGNLAKPASRRKRCKDS
jgi:ABC-type glutathione transport system ATPase component